MDPTIARMEQDLKDLDRSIHTRTVYVQTVKRCQSQFGRPLEELGVDGRPRRLSRRLRTLASN